MAPRTAATAAEPISAPTSRTPPSAVTSVLRTTWSTPTATISPALIVSWIARCTRWLSPARTRLVERSARGRRAEARRALVCRDAMSVSLMTKLFQHERKRGRAGDQRPVEWRQRRETEQTSQRRQRHPGELEPQRAADDGGQDRALGRVPAVATRAVGERVQELGARQRRERQRRRTRSRTVAGERQGVHAERRRGQYARVTGDAQQRAPGQHRR